MVAQPRGRIEGGAVGRVDEGNGLENRRPARVRGFESHPAPLDGRCDADGAARGRAAGRGRSDDAVAALRAPAVGRSSASPGRPPPPPAPGLGETVYGPGKTAEHVVAIVGELLDAGTGPVAGHPGPDETGRRPPWPPTRPASATADAAPGGRPPPARADRAWPAPAPPTCPSPTSAPPSSPPTASSRCASTDVGVAGVHRLLAHADDLAGGRRRRRGGRHGGRLASVVGGLTPASRSWRCPPRWATARRSRGSPPCSGCWRRAPPASPWSASTTATAPPAPCSACSSDAATGSRTAWVHCFGGVAGDMVLGALLDAGADLDVRSARSSAGSASTGGRSTPNRCCGAAWPPPGPSWPRPVRATTTGRGAGHPGTAGRRRPPTGSTTGPTPRSPPWPRSRARCTAMPPDDVHFHEVGALDAIVDVVGVCAALEVAGRRRRRASAPVATGHGTVGRRARAAALGAGPGHGPAAGRRARRRHRRRHGDGHAHRRRPRCGRWRRRSGRCRP